MKKLIYTACITALLLLFCQGYELYYRYKEENRKLTEAIENSFRTAIKLELSGRMTSAKPKDPKNPKFIVRFAEEMTPEERANLKGDTITLKRAGDKGIETNLADLLLERYQDALFKKNIPVRLYALDSLFTQQLRERGLRVTTGIALLDSSRQEIGRVGKLPSLLFHTYPTTVRPLGTFGTLYVQGFAAMSPWGPFQYMFYAILLSGLVILVALGTLYWLLRKTNEARERLRERELAVHSAVHDLKAPLNVAYTAIDLISLSEYDPKRQELLSQGKQRIKGLVATIESMLSLLRKPDGREQMSYQAIRPTELAEEVFQSIVSLYPDKQYSFCVKREEDFPEEVQADRARLERCLRNLLENTLKYSDEGVNITVRLKATTDTWNLSVDDSGWGIPKSVQRRIGCQFFRVKRPDKPQRPGNGLGLSSVFFLMREMGGSVHFRSEEGVGSSFTLTFPKDKHK